MEDETDEFLERVYSQELIFLSEQAGNAGRLPAFDASARVVSPVCGSDVAVELTLRDGRVTGFGYAVEACALTKTVIAVMKKSILGKTRGEVKAAGEDVAAMLAGGGPPSGDWAALKILAPVAAYPARHDSILLPFEAVEKAFAKAV